MVALLARRISISAPSVFVLACTHRLSYASGVRIITSTAVVPPRWKRDIYDHFINGKLCQTLAYRLFFSLISSKHTLFLFCREKTGNNVFFHLLTAAANSCCSSCCCVY